LLIRIRTAATGSTDTLRARRETVPGEQYWESDRRHRFDGRGRNRCGRKITRSSSCATRVRTRKRP